MEAKTASRIETPAAGGVADRLAAVILLAGQVRSTPLISSIGRSLLDLPIEEGRTLLDTWRDEVAQLAVALGRERLVARVVLDRAGVLPEHIPNGTETRVALSIERDPQEVRGTAGVLRDLSRDYDPASYVLVVSASQLLLTPLVELLTDLSATGGGVALVSHEDGTPSGTMLVRCGCLEAVPDVGFVDLKEQALPDMGRGHRVTVVNSRTPTTLPVRRGSGYVLALRVHHGAAEGHRTLENPYAERWRPAFTLVEDGATVAPTAQLQDSVVLRGGYVGDGAVVVRSVICPGARVGRRERVIRRVVGPGAA